MSSTTVTCPSCNATLKPKTPLSVGTRIKCPKCAAVFAVPAEEDDAPAPKPAAPRRLAPRPKPAARREEPEDDSESGEILDDEPEDDEPEDVRSVKRKKKKPKKKGVPLWVWLTAGGGVFLLLCCAGCAGFGYYITNTVLNAGSGSVTFLNYNKIQQGASEAQVKAILGEPAQRVDGGITKIVNWKDGNNIITVNFLSDKAVGRSCHLVTSGGTPLDHTGFADQ
jgi:hypothetical protein